ncbi:MAG: TPM domain-containing protein [archaeon]
MERVLKAIFAIQAIIFAIALLAMPISALDQLTDLVNDEAGVISPQYRSLIWQDLYDLKLNTSVEMAVATVKSLDGITIDEFSLNLAHKTLGEKGKDNGVLILLAVDDREYRIEVGYGLEPVLNAAKLGRIGRNIIEPRFKEGNYEQGLFDGVKAISAILRNDTSAETEGSGSWSGTLVSSASMSMIIFWMIFLLLVFVIPFIVSYRKIKKDKKKKNEKFETHDIIAAIIVANMFGRGRGGGGGFGGGGFGGFGGGSFGGGGFSGRF